MYTKTIKNDKITKQMTKSYAQIQCTEFSIQKHSI